MPQVFKVYLTLFILLIGTLVLVGIISADAETSAARDFHVNVVNEIECSNFSDTVINACLANAATHNNYNLEINKIADSNGKTIAAEVTLHYKYSIPILNVSTDHKINDYAR